MALNNKDSLIDLIMDADSILNDYLTVDEYEPLGEAFCEAIEVIRNSKPVVHGEWLEEPYLLGVTRRCNVCGENYGMPHGVFNYCPNCGATMRGRESSND